MGSMISEAISSEGAAIDAFPMKKCMESTMSRISDGVSCFDDSNPVGESALFIFLSEKSPRRGMLRAG